MLVFAGLLGAALEPAWLVQNLGRADPWVSAGLSLAYPSSPFDAAPGSEPVIVDIDLDIAARRLDPRFLSLAIDTSQLVGGHWWSPSGKVEVGRGSERVAGLELARSELVALARALGPAYLRVGGTEADHVYYSVGDGAVDGVPPGYELSLGEPAWDSLHEFAAAAGLDVFFTINAGPGARGGGAEWRGDNAENLLRYASGRGQQVSVWELGNEVNGYWFIHGLGQQPSGEQYAADLHRFRALVKRYYPSSRVAGPASAFFPVVGEPLSSFFGSIGDVLEHGGSALDIISWHYYPQQSRRCPVATRRAQPGTLLAPAHLDEVNRWSAELRDLRDRWAPAAQLWLGETGHAQCGGEPGASDRFASGFWWLDQLGAAARDGQAIVVRQTLLGADYGLLDDATLTPRPDYYNSLLWKRLMGSAVLDVQVSEENPFLRVYAHCSARTPGSIALLAINVHPLVPAFFQLGMAAPDVERYDLSASGLDSRELLLNGNVMALRDAELAAGERNATVGASGPLVIAPATYSFFELHGQDALACRPGQSLLGYVESSPHARHANERALTPPR